MRDDRDIRDGHYFSEQSAEHREKLASSARRKINLGFTTESPRVRSKQSDAKGFVFSTYSEGGVEKSASFFPYRPRGLCRNT